MKIQILKNYILSQERLPVLNPTYTSTHLINWGLAINHILYYFVDKGENKIVVMKVFHPSVGDLLPELVCDYQFIGYDDVKNTLTRILASHFDSDPRTIQIKIIESFIGFLDDEIIDKVAHDKFYSESNLKIVYDQLQNS